MPLYEYRCKKCGRNFETLARSAHDAEPKCPLCGSEEVERTVGSFSISGCGGCGGGQESVTPPARRFS
ncbi:zinc ribbon domain-containing protein [Chloroflexota bacterium]